MFKVRSLAAIALLIIFTHTGFAQSITNTENTVTFDVCAEEDNCPAVPGAGSGTYQLDISWFDMNIGDWVNVTGLTVNVTVNTCTFTIDASSVAPAVNFPPGEFINTLGNIVLTKPGFGYTLYWDTYYLSCVPLGIQQMAWKPFMRTIF